MANSRISSLTSLGGTPNTAKIIPITDVSDTTGSAQGTTKKVTVANLIAAAPQGDLLAANNLSDVANAGTSRTNLGLGTAATTASTDYATAFYNIVTKTADYTLTNAENGKVIVCNSSVRIDITVPSGLTSGFNCRVVQGGTGAVRFVASSTTINGYQSGSDAPNGIVGQHGVVDIVPVGTNAYAIGGEIGFVSDYANNFTALLDGSDDYLQGATSSDFDFATDFSFTFWMRITSRANYGGIAYSTTSNRLKFQGADHILNLSIGGSDLQIINYNPGGTNTSLLSAWHHVMIIRNSGSLKGYIGNVEYGSQTNTNSFSLTSARYGYNGSDYLGGQLDEIAIFNYGLSSAQRTEIYNSGSPYDIVNSYTGTNPVAFYRCGDHANDTNSSGGSPSNGDTVGAIQNAINPGTHNLSQVNGVKFSTSNLPI